MLDDIDFVYNFVYDFVCNQGLVYFGAAILQTINSNLNSMILFIKQDPFLIRIYLN